MTDYATGPAPQVNNIRDEDAELAGLPVRSSQSTPGYHVPQSETPGSPGWTTHVHGLRQHPTIPGLAAYQVPADPGARAALVGRLNAADQALVNAAGPLDPDWTPPGLDSLTATATLTERTP
jgi:hypothetical protein